MTYLQKQCLLRYLGYDCGVDGIWGPKSRAAALAFQRSRGLREDDTFGEESQKAIRAAVAEETDWWAGIRYFDRKEFACKCGACGLDGSGMDRGLVETADALRAAFGAPITVSSGHRCQSHNAKVGGVANSRHLTGRAMDFCVSGKTAGEILRHVQTLPNIRYAYAIDARFVHMDVE